MRYLSDRVKEQDIRNWNQGSKVLIHAGTGSGKTHFICNTFMKYCNEQNKKVLLLTNRKLLKNQLMNDYQDLENLTIETYQKFTNNVICSKESLVDNYDYIIADECHYFFTDSEFNEKTDILLTELLESAKTCVAIFMSATTYLFEYYLKEEYSDLEIHIIKCKIPKQFQFFYYYSVKHIDKVLKNIPDGEKVMFFSSATTAHKLSRQYEDSAFICADGNKLHEFSDEETKNQIITQSKFDKKYLFTTSVLDNGINIKDRALKHIIVDILDLDTMQQCFGRKRLEEDEVVNIYIKKSTEGNLQKQVDRHREIVQWADEIKNDWWSLFQKHNGKFPDKNLYYTVPVYEEVDTSNENKNYRGYKFPCKIESRLNRAYIYKSKHNCGTYDLIKVSKKEDKGFVIDNVYILAHRLGYKLSEFKPLDKMIIPTYDSKEIAKYVGIDIIDDTKKEFMEWFRMNFLKNQTRDGINSTTIKRLLKENKMPYELISKRKNNKRYWILQKT